MFAKKQYLCPALKNELKISIMKHFIVKKSCLSIAGRPLPVDSEASPTRRKNMYISKY
jgi:hypothetical protein